MPDYYQLGGFRPQIQWYQSTYDDKRLAETVASLSSPLRRGKKATDPLELILGIKPHGSSHLLLTSEQTRQFASAIGLELPRGRPFASRDFESLSPITFESSEDLLKTLSSLKPKAKKSKVAGKAEDTSQANRGYVHGVPNLSRGAFEHGRLLYRIARDTVDPRIYGVEDTPWLNDVEIAAFVFNTQGIDDRPAAERLSSPNVLEIGFSKAALPDVNFVPNSSRYISIERNSMLGRKGKKQPFKFGQSESVKLQDLPTTLQSMFLGCRKPLVLLVNKEDETLNFLRNMNVDVSEWKKSGLKELLYPVGSISESSRRGNNRPWSRDAASSYRAYDNRYQRNRSRSRSPSRSSHHSYRSSSHYSSRESATSVNVRRPSIAPVYVIDVQKWYMALMHAFDVKTVVDIGHRMELTEEAGWWCAGNEAPLLIDIWKSMISGPPIDEQRDIRMGAQAPPLEVGVEGTPGPSSLPVQQLLDEFDEDEDPNDAPAVTTSTTQQPASAQMPRVEYGDFDVSDYGSDSDVSD